MAIVLSIIFLSVPGLTGWFFRDRKVFRKEASDEFAAAIRHYRFSVDPFIVIDSHHPAAETSIGDRFFVLRDLLRNHDTSGNGKTKERSQYDTFLNVGLCPEDVAQLALAALLPPPRVVLKNVGILTTNP